MVQNGCHPLVSKSTANCAESTAVVGHGVLVGPHAFENGDEPADFGCVRSQFRPRWSSRIMATVSWSNLESTGCFVTPLPHPKKSLPSPGCCMYHGWTLFGSACSLVRSRTGQKDHTRPTLNVFVTEGEDSRRGSMNH